MSLTAALTGQNPPTPTGSDIGFGLMVLGLAYFAPTVVALMRGRGAAWRTFWVNALTGWTVVGWLIALVVAFGDHRRFTVIQQVSIVPQSPLLPASWATSVVVSPDGGHWWDGRQWLDATEYIPWGALLSPDGCQWWDGAGWRGGPRRAVPVGTVVDAPWWEREDR